MIEYFIWGYFLSAFVVWVVVCENHRRREDATIPFLVFAIINMFLVIIWPIMFLGAYLSSRS